MARVFGLAAGILLFLGAFASFAVRPGADPKDNWLPAYWNAQAALLFYILGLGLVVFGMMAAIVGRDAIGFWMNVFGLALGGAMAGVVQKEPGSFYGVSAGVFGSLLLALAAVSLTRSDFKGLDDHDD